MPVRTVIEHAHRETYVAAMREYNAGKIERRMR